MFISIYKDPSNLNQIGRFLSQPNNRAGQRAWANQRFSVIQIIDTTTIYHHLTTFVARDRYVSHDTMKNVSCETTDHIKAAHLFHLVGGGRGEPSPLQML